MTGLSSLATELSLPTKITVSTFTAARIKEIQAMRKCIKETTGSKMAFQKLPNHMRRKAMSHVVKRLPRRLREIHINQMKKSGLPPKTKRPSRRYRRRPSNIQSNYAKRRRRIKWLDTHIWHAKRFHIIEKWGYKLPKQPCDKSFKACYRATTRHCLVQDLSYNRCIEISGSYDNIISQLRKITDPQTGLSFWAKCVSEGKKYGEITIFEPKTNNSRMKRAIGDVQFFWNYRKDDEHRSLWLFVHPSYYKQLLKTLTDLYMLNILEDKENANAVYYGSQDVILRELEYEIGKFRLTGPASTAVLKNALRLIDLEVESEELPKWLSDYSTEALSEQNQVFKDLTDTSYIPPHTVLSVIVSDPRLNLPKKKTKSFINSFPNVEDIERLQQNLSISPIFENYVRNVIRDNKVANMDICELRSNLLVPGSDLSIGSGSVIPIILLWRPGNKSQTNNGYASGWDIIVPSNWSQSFFLSFVMWGARAGGLRETESIAFEMSQPDILYPDSIAGEQEEIHISEMLKEKFFRLPPNKRTNFNKFRMASPFCFEWKMLIADWSGKTCDSFSVLRNKNVLRNIQEFLSNKTNLPSLPENCLVPVKVTPVAKGVCSRFSIICVPRVEDIHAEPVEPKCNDPLAQKRKIIRNEHKNLLQKLRRRRKRATRMGKPITSTDVEVLRKYKTEMRNLWLPEPKTVRGSCSIPVIGFIKHGGFSFTISRSKGLGYIAADSLIAFASLQKRNRVLVRNSNSRQYRIAILNVVE